MGPSISGEPSVVACKKSTTFSFRKFYNWEVDDDGSVNKANSADY